MQSLLQRARAGERCARAELTALVTPMIQFQTDKFCRRFCQNTYQHARCTLTPPMAPHRRQAQDAPLCDKANASYAWMLDDLTNDKRLPKIRAANQAQALAYFKTLINSLPFYERWKNWRFERRVHVPTYVAAIADEAGQIFLALQSGHAPPIIAQKLGLAENTVIAVADRIIVELTRRRRLHLLNPSKTLKFSELGKPDPDDDGNAGYEVEDANFAPEKLVLNEQVRKIWASLTELEQFVIEALVIEQQDAKHVLAALTQLGIALKENQRPEDNDRQQLYYFKRKTLEKLSVKLKVE